jgi:hypothetical protein
MKESDNLKPINQLDSSLPEVSPSEEKEIIHKLSAEAYAFVPDKLMDIMAACHLDAQVAPSDEAEIISALEGESQAFTPHSLSSIQKATNTYNPSLDTASLALNEKVKNEGADIVPNVEDEVYEKTGARRHFSFKKHWIAWTSGMLVGAASIAMVVMVTNGTFATAAQGTYVSVSVTPASYASTQTSIAYAYNSASNGTTISMNSNTPKWSFSADSSNLVNPSTFSADNYSAKLVAFAPTNKVQAYEVVKDLVAPSYRNGYLETKDPSIRNVITITVSSTQSDYDTKYASEYQSQVNSALTSNKIYATVNFVFNDLSSSLKNVKDATAESYVELFNGLSDAYNGGLSIDTIKSIPTDIVDAMNGVISSAASAKLSLRSLRALKQGLVKSYKYYVGDEKSSLSAAKAAATRQDLIAHAGSLPWASITNLSLVQSGLTKDAYYVMGSFIAGSDSGTEWDEYKDIRNYLFSTRESTVSEYVSFLNEVKALADLSQNATGYLPDGYQNEMPDMGGHDHGNGPDGGGWGDGGATWHEGPGGQSGPGGR